MPGIGGPMVRNRSQPVGRLLEDGSRAPFRKRKPKPPPESWSKDWQALPTGYTNPRWSQSKEGFQSTVDRPFNTHTGDFKEQKPFIEAKPRHRGEGPQGRFRDTWIQKHMREHHWVPGPGAYRTEREFIFKTEDELDSNLTRQEQAAKYSFGKEGRETCQTMKEIKEAKLTRNSGSWPKLEPWFTPGPGEHLCYTTFGAPSGGSRKQYFAGSATNIWDTRASR